MYFFDQHIHCNCSPDSEAPMRSMAEAARDHGMDMVLFTDHVDMCSAETGAVEPYWPDCAPKMAAAMSSATVDIMLLKPPRLSIESTTLEPEAPL